MSKQKVVVVTGPTATGKTTFGAMLAKEVGGEVVSADSMQVYRLMDIGTAKPTAEEMLGIPHHMLDIVPPWEEYSVARYVSDAVKCIGGIINRGKIPIIVGGTGLYIDSLLSGREFSPRGDARQRKELETEYDRIGGDGMLRELVSFDPESAKKLNANDKKRIVRAFEVYNMTGKTITQHDLETKSFPPRYSALYLALNFNERAALYSRICSRVDAMLAAGLEGEVRGLLKLGVSQECTAMQAIGYKEMAGAISGAYSAGDAAGIIKQRSRNYAKRQLSWFRRDKDTHWIIWDKEPDYTRIAHYRGLIAGST